jgi:KDO2-lipid IV(A) lauroyltransferase
LSQKRQQGIWLALSVIERTVRLLPHRWALAFGAGLGSLVRLCSRKRVDKAEARCVRALGVGVSTAREIVTQSYRNLGRSLVEFYRLPLTASHIGDYVTIHGEDHLRQALERGKGVILMTAHFGSWEVAAAMLARGGFPMNAIGAEQRDERITAKIESLRAQAGVKPIGKGFDLKAALACLRRGEILGVLLDQDARDKGMVVPFLGLPASTPYGPVKLAHKLGAAVVPIFTVRRPDGFTHDLHLLPPLEGKSGPFGADLEADLAQCNEILSRWIRDYPDHWLWLYPRWMSTLGDD